MLLIQKSHKCKLHKAFLAQTTNPQKQGSSEFDLKRRPRTTPMPRTPDAMSRQTSSGDELGRCGRLQASGVVDGHRGSNTRRVFNVSKE